MSYMYRSQVLKLEESLAAVREEENVGKKLLKVSVVINYFLFKHYKNVIIITSLCIFLI